MGAVWRVHPRGGVLPQGEGKLQRGPDGEVLDEGNLEPGGSMRMAYTHNGYIYIYILSVVIVSLVRSFLLYHILCFVCCV